MHLVVYIKKVCKRFRTKKQWKTFSRKSKKRLPKNQSYILNYSREDHQIEFRNIKQTVLKEILKVNKMFRSRAHNRTSFQSQ